HGRADPAGRAIPGRRHDRPDRDDRRARGGLDRRRRQPVFHQRRPRARQRRGRRPGPFLPAAHDLRRHRRRRGTAGLLAGTRRTGIRLMPPVRRASAPPSFEGVRVTAPLFPSLAAPTDDTAVRFGDRTLTYRELAHIAGGIAARLRDCRRVAVWATPTLETALGAVGALLAGVPAVPINPKIGERELAHIVSDSTPDAVLAAPGDDLPGELANLPRIDLPGESSTSDRPAEPDAEAPALIVYTSGTTGAPKGVVLPRRAIASTLDALEDAWQWTSADTVVHGLPLFHVHGLILGILGPLRRGGTAWLLGKFSLDALTDALAGGGTMMFGVPTMYHRIAEEVGSRPALAEALRAARLLVSGSAALPVHDQERIFSATGQRVVERYGMTETLMNTSVRADGERKP